MCDIDLETVDMNNVTALLPTICNTSCLAILENLTSLCPDLAVWGNLSYPAIEAACAEDDDAEDDDAGLVYDSAGSLSPSLAVAVMVWGFFAANHVLTTD
jgi:hypothetical protein